MCDSEYSADMIHHLQGMPTPKRWVTIVTGEGGEIAASDDQGRPVRVEVDDQGKKPFPRRAEGGLTMPWNPDKTGCEADDDDLDD